MHLGATLRLLRLQSGLGLRDLARRLDVSSAYLSRVESGLDAAPTTERLEVLARELGVPATLLIDLAQRMSPFVTEYLEEVPEAGTLFLELAHRRLNPAQLAEVRAFVAERFPSTARSLAMPELQPLAEVVPTDQMVLGLRCSTLDDAIEMAAGRLAARIDGKTAVELSAALTNNEASVSSALGGGVAIPSVHLSGVKETCALVTFARPLKQSTPDDQPLKLMLAFVWPKDVPASRLRIAQVARLSARGLAEAVAPLQSPAQVRSRLAQLEQWR